VTWLSDTRGLTALADPIDYPSRAVCPKCGLTTKCGPRRGRRWEDVSVQHYSPDVHFVQYRDVRKLPQPQGGST
jgi:hypothetical protein